MSVNKAVLKVTTREAFYKWLEVTYFFHKLTGVEMELLAAFLYHRYILSREISNEVYINKVLFSSETKRLIRQELGWKPQIFLNGISSLRRKGAMVGDSIKKQFIPQIPKDLKEGYKIEFEFKFKDNEG